MKMEGCFSIGGPALCTAVAIVALLDLTVLAVLVGSRQGWLLRQRLRKPGHWLTSKTAVFYSIGLENLSMMLHCALFSRMSPILHLIFDYSQFLLFTCVFYYFALHTFQIMGRTSAVRLTIYSLTGINVLYLSGFTVYIAVQMIMSEVGNYCTSIISLSPALAHYASERLRSQPHAGGDWPLRRSLFESKA